MSEKITYAEAGVDIEAGDRAVELMKESVSATLNSKVVEAAGGFAGLIDISDLSGIRPNGQPITHPVLSTSTDGCGTKVAIAQAIDKHDTVGQDLVGMVVDDIAVTGAKPLMMTDYIATGKVYPERIADIVRGVAEGCKLADTALVGGETAEHPGLLKEDEYDVAGAATGIIDYEDLLGPDRVNSGDTLIAISSSGLHSNGFSLVRKVFSSAGWDYSKIVPELGSGVQGGSNNLSENPTLGEALLVPTRIYSKCCLDMAKIGLGEAVNTFSHVTGGGIASNLARVLPQGVVGVVDKSTWEIPNVFKMVSELGQVPLDDLEKTLNLGIGMIAVVDKKYANDCISLCKKFNFNAWTCGSVLAQSDFENQYSGYDQNRLVSGTKGVSGGSAILI
ncbi:MAG: phosphoribosylformylglycinamidine cyclo-ligase [Candidatus Ancillula sp.]|jgi:phosphoribosylformylglycinamidine cyclo-ligase|nr:phosphoribosylformylglycinamidine cyclo-ligase [Candidatus Ancillula sp.]